MYTHVLCCNRWPAVVFLEQRAVSMVCVICTLVQCGGNSCGVSSALALHCGVSNAP